MRNMKKVNAKGKPTGSLSNAGPVRFEDDQKYQQMLQDLAKSGIPISHKLWEAARVKDGSLLFLKDVKDVKVQDSMAIGDGDPTSNCTGAIVCSTPRSNPLGEASLALRNAKMQLDNAIANTRQCETEHKLLMEKLIALQSEKRDILNNTRKHFDAMVDKERAMSETVSVWGK